MGVLCYIRSKTFEILKGHFDLIVNTVSIETDLNQYSSLLGLDGTMVIVGLPEKEMSIGAFSLINARRSIAGSVIGRILGDPGDARFLQ
jgi:alcohol dehydrogenase (NADP+)